MFFLFIWCSQYFEERENGRYAASTRVKNRRNLSKSIKRNKKVLTVIRRLIICKLIICTLTTIWFKLIGFDSIYNVLNHFSLFWINVACFESIYNVCDSKYQFWVKIHVLNKYIKIRMVESNYLFWFKFTARTWR